MSVDTIVIDSANDVDNTTSADFLCDICYDHDGEWKCANCNCNICYECMKEWIHKKDMICPSCGSQVDVNDVYKILGGTKRELNVYIHSIAEKKFQDQQLDIDKYIRCINALKYVRAHRKEWMNNKSIIKSCVINGTEPPSELSDLINALKNDDIGYEGWLMKSQRRIIQEQYKLFKNKSLGEARPNCYIHRCSKCDGFVNTAHRCVLCEQEYCKECWKPLTPGHVCNEDDIYSVDELLENTEPCPKCAARIYKDDGCNEMFCINCQCGFDWGTKRLIKGWFHNPDREDWYKTHQLGTNINDTNDIDILIDQIDFYGEYTYEYYDRIINNVILCLRTFENMRDTKSLVKHNVFRDTCLHLLGDISKEDYVESLSKEIMFQLKYNKLKSIYVEYAKRIYKLAEKFIVPIRNYLNTDYMLDDNVRTILYSITDQYMDIDVFKLVFECIDRDMNKEYSAWWWSYDNLRKFETNKYIKNEFKQQMYDYCERIVIKYCSGLRITKPNNSIIYPSTIKALADIIINFPDNRSVVNDMINVAADIRYKLRECCRTFDIPSIVCPPARWRYDQIRFPGGTWLNEWSIWNN